MKEYACRIKSSTVSKDAAMMKVMMPMSSVTPREIHIMRC
jgi:hypothetical protein